MQIHPGMNQLDARQDEVSPQQRGQLQLQFRFLYLQHRWRSPLPRRVADGQAFDGYSRPERPGVHFQAACNGDCPPAVGRGKPFDGSLERVPVDERDSNQQDDDEPAHDAGHPGEHPAGAADQDLTVGIGHGRSEGIDRSE